ncbi:SPFH/Band 7/PHB domain protein [Francisellaceae bacterium]|nr:SPFH/Band 7/PHB domain protein [Francisellaceae bacterium]
MDIDTSLIIAGIIVIAVVAIMVSAVKIVSQGYEYILERFGRYQRTLKPGLNLIIPIMDRVIARVNVKETVLNVRKQEVITHDNASVEVDAIAFYQVLDPKKATYIINDLEVAIDNLVMTNTRTVLGSMPLDEMLSNRDVINHRLLSVLDEATDPWGVKIVRVEIKDISPPKDLIDAMAQQMKAERLKRSEILRAEGIKQSKILEAEGSKQSEILNAEGEKRKRELEAEGEKAAKFRQAEALERTAEAEAKATQSVSIAISEGKIEAIQYFIAQKYVDALGQVASSENSKTIMMPLEASGILGSVAGVADLLKQTSIKPGK